MRNSKSNKKTSKIKRRVVFSVILALMVVIIILLARTAYRMKEFQEFEEAYSGCFFEGTTINGMDVAGMTVDEVEARLEESAGDYDIDIIFRNGTETITGDQMNYHYVSDGSVDRLFRRQDAQIWFDEYLKNGRTPTPVSETVAVETVFDGDLLLDAVRALPEMQDENMVEASDAHMDYVDAKFVVVPEEEGTTLDKKIVLRSVLDAADAYEPEIDLTAIPDVYTSSKVSVASVGPELQAECDRLNEFCDASVTLTLWNGEERTLDGTITKDWISDDGYGNSYKDWYVWNDGIRSFVQSAAEVADTVGKTRLFDATGIGEIAVSGGNYGYQIDVEAEVEKITEELESHKAVTRDPIYASVETATENNGIGYDYVEVDCTRQYMWIYIDGEVALETDVVTGLMTESRATPAGICLVYNKALDYTLIGQGNSYRTPVSYWMPFNGACGFHDAWWRSAFGGDIYLYDGSHGCVNMPVDKAAEAFDLITFEMPIVVYYS